MRCVNRAAILAGIASALTVFVSTYLLHSRTEALVANTAKQFILNSPEQGDALLVAQLYERIFCSSTRHQSCSVRIIDPLGNLLASVPSVALPEKDWPEMIIKLDEKQFSPPLKVIISFTPSNLSLMIWASLSLVIWAFVIITFWLLKLRLAKQSALESLRLQLELKEAEANIGKLAAQVAHDIRSPLAALGMIIDDLEQLPKEQRTILRSAMGRIKDIANGLLTKNREVLKGTFESDRTKGQSSIQLIPSLIESLVTEKRVQFRSKIGVEIDERLEPSSYGAFVRVDPIEFKRMLSNLVDNAVEAVGGRGRITIEVTGRKDTIEVRVCDSGKGIAANVLQKLMRFGGSYGKSEGSGLGLHHAKTMMKVWDGELHIESKIDLGTKVTISLPRSTAPEWFVSELAVLPGGRVAILDDDTTIHQVWSKRFEEKGHKVGAPHLLHFSTPNDLASWIKRDSDPMRSTLFLIDYELIGESETGISIIERLGIKDQSILVTSHFEETSLREACEKLRIKLIPKGMAALAPIRIQTA